MIRLFSLLPLLCFLGLAGFAQAPPGHVAEGDRVERRFRVHVEELERFHVALAALLRERAPALLPQLDTPPPVPMAFGYQVLPSLVAAPPDDGPPVTTFAYSWPITAGYVAAEETRLAQAASRLAALLDAGADVEAGGRQLVQAYRQLVGSQRAVDQYIQYNRFWQRVIAEDRRRFDALTEVYHALLAADREAAASIRQGLGRPDAPAFVSVLRAPEATVLRVPVYTDIADAVFLDRVRREIEARWQASAGEARYRVEIEYRPVGAESLYPAGEAPAPGARLDVRAHAARFPADGAVLTTGAETTHALVGRYVAFGPGEIYPRTLAHEFGHILGFRDGYVRGYRDLGEQGFEILELTSLQEDIMISPRRGEVQAEHFRWMLEAIDGR